MSLNKTTLNNAVKAAIDAAFTAAAQPGAVNNTIRTNYSTSITDAIDDYIKGMRITIPSGAINVTGTAAAQSNPAPIVLNNAVS